MKENKRKKYLLPSTESPYNKTDTHIHVHEGKVFTHPHANIYQHSPRWTIGGKGAEALRPGARCGRNCKMWQIYALSTYDSQDATPYYMAALCSLLAY